jgi:hypothetical protein
LEVGRLRHGEVRKREREERRRRRRRRRGEESRTVSAGLESRGRWACSDSSSREKGGE